MSNTSVGDRPPQITTDSSATTGNFADDLDGVFNLAGSNGHLDSLASTVAAKRQTVNFKSKELEELEARLAAAESALQQKAENTRTSQTNGQSNSAAANTASGASRANGGR